MSQTLTDRFFQTDSYRQTLAKAGSIRTEELAFPAGIPLQAEKNTG